MTTEKLLGGDTGRLFCCGSWAVFGGLFKSKEVKAVLAAIDALENEEGARGLRHIKGLVARLVVKNSDKIKQQIAETNISPRALIFRIIHNVLSELLPSGQHHMYRGVLTMPGKELLRLWDYLVEQNEISGHYDEEEAIEAKKWIRDGIKVVG